MIFHLLVVTHMLTPQCLQIGMFLGMEGHSRNTIPPCENEVEPKTFVMKHYYLGFILLFCFTLLSSFSSTVEMDSVVGALKSGDANSIARYFDNRVDIALPDRSDNYSRTQAAMVLRDFFVSNGVVSFEIKHRGENGGCQYCVGVLQTKNGDYRTTLFMKQKGPKQYLQEMHFQSSE
jgi:Domain of unknown function (DUF4783)